MSCDTGTALPIHLIFPATAPAAGLCGRESGVFPVLQAAVQVLPQHNEGANMEVAGVATPPCVNKQGWAIVLPQTFGTDDRCGYREVGGTNYFSHFSKPKKESDIGWYLKELNCHIPYKHLKMEF